MTSDARPDWRTRDDEVWFRAAYDEHWAPMVRLAALLLGSSSEADEVVQEAMLGLLKHRRRLGDRPVGGYLRTSVVNGCRSVHRHRGVVRRSIHLEDASPVSDPATGVVESAAVMAALRTLPDRQQEVLILRYYSDLSEADIAEALGISRGAVKSSASRGIEKLRMIMERDAR